MIRENLISGRDFNWIDIQEPTDTDFNRISDEFNLPYLLIQDTLRPEHLPKFEESDDGYFLMMRSFDTEASVDDVSVQSLTRKIAFFVTEKRLITIHRVGLDFIDTVAERAQKSEHPKTLHSLIHQVILATIRSYEAPVTRLQDQYDEFEQEILEKNAEHLSTTRIYHFRRQTFILKRILKQTNDALHRSRDFWIEQPSMLQDLRENIDQIYFRLDEVSDNFEHLFQLHVALNDQRSNEVMKVLTVFSTILLPLNFLASFYGMNFEHIPGLHSVEALHAVVGVMIFITISAYIFFKSKGWFRTARE